MISLRRRQSGMSLIEVLVAITISGIALSSVMFLLSAGIKNMRKMEKQLGMTQQARLVLNRMVREIASAFHPYGMYGYIPYREGTNDYMPWMIVRTAASTLATGGGKEMSFVASLYQKNELEAPPEMGDLCEIHYYLAGSATSASPRHLYRRKDLGVLGVASAGTDASDGTNILTDKWANQAGAESPTVLGFYVKNLDFKVYDRTGILATLPFTYDASSAATGFPSRLRIFVTFYDPDAVVPDMTFATDVSVMRNND